MHLFRDAHGLRGGARLSQPVRHSVAVDAPVGSAARDQPDGQRERRAGQAGEDLELGRLEIVKVRHIKVIRQREPLFEGVREVLEAGGRVAVSARERTEIRVVDQGEIAEFVRDGGGCGCGGGAKFVRGYAAVPERGQRRIKLLREPRRACGSAVAGEFVSVLVDDLGEQHDRPLRGQAALYLPPYRLFCEAGEGSDGDIERRAEPERAQHSAFGGCGEFVGNDDDMFAARRQPLFKAVHDRTVGAGRRIGKNDLHAYSITRFAPF